MAEPGPRPKPQPHWEFIGNPASTVSGFQNQRGVSLFARLSIMNSQTPHLSLSGRVDQKTPCISSSFCCCFSQLLTAFVSWGWGLRQRKFVFAWFWRLGATIKVSPGLVPSGGRWRPGSILSLCDWRLLTIHCSSAPSSITCLCLSITWGLSVCASVSKYPLFMRTPSYWTKATLLLYDLCL